MIRFRYEGTELTAYRQENGAWLLGYVVLSYSDLLRILNASPVYWPIPKPK